MCADTHCISVTIMISALRILLQPSVEKIYLCSGCVRADCITDLHIGTHRTSTLHYDFATRLILQNLQLSSTFGLEKLLAKRFLPSNSFVIPLAVMEIPSSLF